MGAPDVGEATKRYLRVMAGKGSEALAQPSPTSGKDQA